VASEAVPATSRSARQRLPGACDASFGLFHLADRLFDAAAAVGVVITRCTPARPLAIAPTQQSSGPGGLRTFQFVTFAGEPSWNTVKDCLHKNARRPDSPIERVNHGRYRHL